TQLRVMAMGAGTTFGSRSILATFAVMARMAALRSEMSCREILLDGFHDVPVRSIMVPPRTISFGFRMQRQEPHICAFICGRSARALPARLAGCSVGACDAHQEVTEAVTELLARKILCSRSASLCSVRPTRQHHRQNC